MSLPEAVLVKHLDTAPHVVHHGDAAGDLIAAEDMFIAPGEYEFLQTRTSVELPYGYAGLVFSRSGHGRKGVGLVNGVGLIDSGYRGVIGVTLKNDGPDGFTVKAGDRVAQFMVIIPVPVAYVQSDELSSSERGVNGFGSTGVANLAAQ